MTNNEHKAAPTVAGLESLTRYEEYFRGDCYAGMDDSKDGEWVRFADVERWAASHAGASAVPAPAGQHTDGWPGEIYLNAGDDPLGHFSGYDEVSWCDHPQGESDVRYVRAEAATPSTAAVRAAALEEAAYLCECVGTDWLDANDVHKNFAADYLAKTIRALINTPAADGGNGSEG